MASHPPPAKINLACASCHSAKMNTAAALEDAPARTPRPFPSLTSQALPLPPHAPTYSTTSRPGLPTLLPAPPPVSERFPASPVPVDSHAASSPHDMEVTPLEVILSQQRTLSIAFPPDTRHNAQRPPPPQSFHIAEGDTDDPFAGGLLTVEEAKQLHAIYFEELTHISSVLDPVLDTLDSVRERSPLLLTAICLSASRFQPGAQALNIRLERHLQQLLRCTIPDGPASLELSEALLVICSHLPPARDELRDPTSRFFSIAMSSYREVLAYEKRLGTILDTRQKRRRQRLHLVLYQFDSGYSIISGRPSTLNISATPQELEDWCNEPEALFVDELIGSYVSLRMAMANSPLFTTTNPLGPSTIKAMSDDIFAAWEQQWLARPNLSKSRFLVLVRRHSELTLLSTAALKRLATPLASSALAGTIAQVAISVCEQTVKLGEAGRNISNHTLTAIVYAALTLIKLNHVWPAETDVLSLLRQVATLLTLWGAVTPHRHARSTLYAGYLTRAIDMAYLADLPLPPPEDEPASASTNIPSGPTLSTPAPDHFAGAPDEATPDLAVSEFSTFQPDAGSATSLDQLMMLMPMENDAWNSWLSSSSAFGQDSLFTF